MMDHLVKIIHIDWLTHDVIRLKLEKPEFYIFKAGQAIEATIDIHGFRNDRAPFTLTGLAGDDYLELILKVYSDHKGMSLAISELKIGDSLIISDAWDSYPNKGPGTFIAGGTGITPFIAILRQLKAEGMVKGSRLFFYNKTEEDVFLYDELYQILGDRFLNIFTRQRKEGFLFGRIDKDFIKSHFKDYMLPVYICGPNNFAEQVRELLIEENFEDTLINISY
jgi:ferredoxin-NADP reductase